MRLELALSRARVLGFVVVVATLGAPGAAQASQETTDDADRRQFGAEYAGLSDVQKALIDDIFRRFGEITGRQVDAEQAYNGVRLSVRTTFDAVTHALSTSTLADAETGESLGTALDLIDHLESVQGKLKGAGGDRQFRLYVALKPGVIELLNRSEEFSRKGDNTIFHKGYPLNYRQEGVPSMQVSISRDGKRADIDVDYRSERFPAALVNGHLTAANSDIRAGNYSRHTQRWEGLVNWWEGFFGRLFTSDTYEGEDDEGQEFPLEPRAGKKTIDVAVHDFLSSWLVEQQPNLSTAYMAREAYECLAQRMEAEGEALDPGLARFQLYMRMKAISDQLGPRESLEGTTLGVRLHNPNLKLVQQKHHAQFVLYGVPKAFAEQMKCENYTRLGKLPKDRLIRFVGEKPESFFSLLYLAVEGGSGATLGLLWEMREGHWKIVAYEAETEGETEQNSLPDIGTMVQTAEVPRQAGDPAFIAASERFLEAWLVDKQYDEAFGYFSPRCYPCVNLYPDPGEPPKETREEQAARLRLGVERLGEEIGKIERLEDIIEGVEPWDPRVRIIEHPRAEAFGLFMIPDWAGEQADCEKRLARSDAPSSEGGNREFGRYNVSALQVETYTGEPAVLYLGWTKENDAWRIFAYKVVDP